MLEEVVYDTDVADVLRAQLHGVTAELVTAATRGVCIDARFGGNQESAAILSREGIAPSGTRSFWRAATVANTPNFYAPPRGFCILPPGLAVDFATNGNNMALRVALRWRERMRDRFEI